MICCNTAQSINGALHSVQPRAPKLAPVQCCYFIKVLQTSSSLKPFGVIMTCHQQGIDAQFSYHAAGRLIRAMYGCDQGCDESRQLHCFSTKGYKP